MHDGKPRPGSEDYWAEKRRRRAERVRENDAGRRANHRGIKQRRLNCGCDWYEVLWLFGGRKAAALAFWEHAEQWEHEHPGVPRHNHFPPFQPYG